MGLALGDGAYIWLSSWKCTYMGCFCQLSTISLDMEWQDRWWMSMRTDSGARGVVKPGDDFGVGVQPHRLIYILLEWPRLALDEPFAFLPNLCEFVVKL